MDQFQGVQSARLLLCQSGDLMKAKVGEQNFSFTIENEQGIEHVVEQMFISLLTFEEFRLCFFQLVGGDLEFGIENLQRPAWGSLFVRVSIASLGQRFG